jgi:hypothetical protein
MAAIYGPRTLLGAPGVFINIRLTLCVILMVCAQVFIFRRAENAGKLRFDAISGDFGALRATHKAS